jgi:glutamine amidotransferase
MIGIVDLDMSNLRSVANAIDRCGHESLIVREPGQLSGLTHLILPGVGSYAEAMARMRRQELFAPIRAFAASGKPLLGICLGMQLLSSRGDEGGGSEGLDLVGGTVSRFDAAQVPKIPHVGWNEARLVRAHPVFTKVKSGVDFYYVHSYRFVCSQAEDCVATVEYGGNPYTSIVGRRNVLGFQFHPEKSQASGLKLLENFCDWDGAC